MKPKSVAGTGSAGRTVAPRGWTGPGGQRLESLAGHVEEFDFL